MEQVIVGGRYTALDTANTEYASLQATGAWHASEWTEGAKQLVTTPGVIKNLRVKLSGSPGAGKHYDFTLMLNGAPTTLTIEIADAATSGADTTHEVDVVAGDSISLQCDPDGVPTLRRAFWTAMFEGSEDRESLILGSGRNNVGLARYTPIMCSFAITTNVESIVYQICPTAGVIKNLYVEMDVDPGTAPDAYRYTLRVNGAASDDGEGNPLQVTIVADDKTGNDTTHEITVAAGDILTMYNEPLNAPSGVPEIAWGFTFVADTDGESVILSACADALPQGVTEYIELSSWGRSSTWGGTENQHHQLGQECTLKKLYMRLTVAPGAGNKYTFTVRIAGDSNVVVEIADAATTGNSGALTDTVANDDYLSLKVVPFSNPDTFGYEAWGLVCFIVPPVAYEKALSDSVAVVESSGLEVEYTRSLSDTVAVAEAVGKAIGVAKSESVGVAESSGLEAEFARSLSDTVVVAEAVVKAPSLFKVDTVAITDSISVVKILNKALADTIAIADSITSKAIGVFKTDTVAVAETFSRVVKFYKSLTDTVAVAEAIVKAYSLVRAETIAVAENLTRKAIGIFRAETVAVAESFSYIRGVFKTLADTIAITDTTQKAVSIVKADTVAVTDSIGKAFGKFRTETIAIAENITLIFKTISLTLKSRLFSFALKARTFSFTLKER